MTSGRLAGAPCLDEILLKGTACLPECQIFLQGILIRYTAGDCRQYSPADLTHAMLAFEYPGGWNDVKGSTAVTVLQFLMGGGGSFSAGGPGRVLRLCLAEL